MSFDHAAYLDVIELSRRQQMLAAAVAKLKDVDFDAIACTGVSGLLFAPSLAEVMGKELIVVRKEQDTKNHSHRDVEGYYETKKYIFVDDQISFGDTFRRVKEQVKNFVKYAHLAGSPPPVCVATYEYIYNRLNVPKPEEPEKIDESFVSQPSEPPITSPIVEGPTTSVAEIRGVVDALKSAPKIEWYSPEALETLKSILDGSPSLKPEDIPF